MKAWLLYLIAALSGVSLLFAGYTALNAADAEKRQQQRQQALVRREQRAATIEGQRRDLRIRYIFFQFCLSGYSRKECQQAARGVVLPPLTATTERRIIKILGKPGKRGPLGPRGLRGLASGAGIQGKRGKLGPRGLRGPAGQHGITGERGVAGARGARGPAGSPGPRGAPGPRGLPGPPGPIGVPGPIGPPGGTFQCPAGYTLQVRGRGSILLVACIKT